MKQVKKVPLYHYSRIWNFRLVETFVWQCNQSKLCLAAQNYILRKLSLWVHFYFFDGQNILERNSIKGKINWKTRKNVFKKNNEKISNVRTFLHIFFHVPPTTVVKCIFPLSFNWRSHHFINVGGKCLDGLSHT